MSRAQEIDIQVRILITLFTVTTAGLFGSVATGYVALVNSKLSLLWGCVSCAVLCSLMGTALALILVNRAKTAREVRQR